MTTIGKNAQGYGYKYTDLAEIHNYLEANGMKYIQRVIREDGDDYIETKRFVDGAWESEWIRGCRVVQATLQGIKNPAQEQGSALTYARRYSVLMAFGLATTDDDAASLSRKVEAPKKEAPKKEEVTPEMKRELMAICNAKGILAQVILEDYGWKRGETLTVETYNKALKYANDYKAK